VYNLIIILLATTAVAPQYYRPPIAYYRPSARPVYSTSSSYRPAPRAQQSYSAPKISTSYTAPRKTSTPAVAAPNTAPSPSKYTGSTSGSSSSSNALPGASAWYAPDTTPGSTTVNFHSLASGNTLAYTTPYVPPQNITDQYGNILTVTLYAGAIPIDPPVSVFPEIGAVLPLVFDIFANFAVVGQATLDDPHATGGLGTQVYVRINANFNGKYYAFISAKPCPGPLTAPGDPVAPNYVLTSPVDQFFSASTIPVWDGGVKMSGTCTSDNNGACALGDLESKMGFFTVTNANYPSTGSDYLYYQDTRMTTTKPLQYAVNGKFVYVAIAEDPVTVPGFNAAGSPISGLTYTIPVNTVVACVPAHMA